jgi:hypothetical protein
MRALQLHRALVSVSRHQWIQQVTQGYAQRHFGSTICRHEENPSPESPAPRRRGRPKKVRDEETNQDKTETVIAASSDLTPPLKLSKPKRPPKISDITRLIPPSVLSTSPARPLRPYQEDCVEACLNAISEGKRRLGISLATGAGKTVIFTNLIGKVQLDDPKRYQTIILVHRRELVEQAARHCVEAYPDKVCPLRTVADIDC